MIGALSLIAAGAFAERFVMGRIAARPDRVPPGPLLPEAETEEFWIDASDGGIVHAQAAGEGRPVIFIHGVTMTSAIWYQQYRLVNAGFRVMTLDLVGHGGSTVGRAGAGIAANAARLGELLDDDGAAGAVVVGHSMGGMALGQMLVDFPHVADRLAAAVFVGSAARLPAQVRWPSRLDRLNKRVSDWVGRHPARAARWHRIPGNDLGDLMVRGSFGVAPSPRHVTLTAECYDRSDPAVWAEANDSILHFDISDRLAAVKVPSLVLVGERDRLTPPVEASVLHQALGGPSRLRVIPGRGHQLMLEQPSVVDQAVVDALALR